MTTGIMMELWKTLAILSGFVPKGEVMGCWDIFEKTTSD
jgi:hypothetical protein